MRLGEEKNGIRYKECEPIQVTARELVRARAKHEGVLELLGTRYHAGRQNPAAGVAW